MPGAEETGAHRNVEPWCVRDPGSSPDSAINYTGPEAS